MAWAPELRLNVTQIAVRTSTLAIAVTATDCGLTLPVAVGVYNISVYLPLVLVGAPTNTVSAVSGPAVDADWVVAFTRYNAAAPTALYTRTTAAALAATTGATVLASVNLVTVSGAVRFNAAGNFAVSLTRTGGTSSTLRIGAYAQLTRIG